MVILKCLHPRADTGMTEASHSTPRPSECYFPPGLTPHPLPLELPLSRGVWRQAELVWLSCSRPLYTAYLAFLFAHSQGWVTAQERGTGQRSRDCSFPHPATGRECDQQDSHFLRLLCLVPAPRPHDSNTLFWASHLIRPKLLRLSQSGFPFYVLVIFLSYFEIGLSGKSVCVCYFLYLVCILGTT